MNTFMLFSAMLLQQTVSPGGFPHQRHTRVFPVCEGCHSGVTSGVAAKSFPSLRDCAGCHDGVRKNAVELRPRVPRASNLRFSHVEHRQAAEKKGQRPRCQSCHASGDEPARMAVASAEPARCMTCHARAGQSHLAPDMQCSRCHVPLTAAPKVAADRVARFPRPEWHAAPSFASGHGRAAADRLASCGVCHGRETCERCHANANRLPLVQSLARDARVAAAEEGKRASYFRPASHAAPEWSAGHARVAHAQTESCANCHLQSSCTRCHQSGSTARPVIATLPVAPLRAGSAPSVARIERRVHPLDIARSHGSMAATNRAECAQCHGREQCASCHASTDARRFHSANYAERHAPDVFSSGSRCQSCHNTETFCRACHTSTGVAAGGRMNAAFHNDQPMWVLAHGQAARIGLDACAACHRQSDCTRCHSASGGWGVNPHRSGFQASRMAARSTASCRICHIADPLKGK